ncbi:MAG: energy transducer TonB [Gammaproteobacteria bacterium]
MSASNETMNTVNSHQHLSMVARAESAAGSLLKVLVCVTLATIVSLLLFRFDSALINRPKNFDDDIARVKILEFIHVQPDEFVYSKERRLPKKPPPPDRPPPPPKVRVNSPTEIPQSMMNMDMPDIEMGFGAGGGPYIGEYYGGRQNSNMPDGDVMPIVRIEPRYPRDALLRGLEGWVKVEFTITAEGSVTDAVVVASEPQRTFDRSAVQAVLRWKFKPRFVDGNAISRRAVQTIEFQLDADS